MDPIEHNLDDTQRAAAAKPATVGSTTRRQSAGDISSALVVGIAAVAVMLLTAGVIGGQAWMRWGEVRARSEADASAPANRTLATAASYEQSADPQTSQAIQFLVANAGRTGWPTTQPEQIQAASTAPLVAGLNKARVKTGMAVFQRFGCAACHTTDGRAGVGPSLLDVFGSTVDLSTGASVVADADFIRESIRQPAAKIHRGYTPVMPDFGPQIKDREIEGLIEFLKSISPSPQSRKETGPLQNPT
ncbi:c-type cytochrome [Humisphaera borealis]|uniref:C-type cytochrome n=1 Tax=Humisphaera borealis TaxID=2807512 RepID=A0A7M2WSD3_9BACT|nr:c-type cytochrome [Humisphaera borealis]QOV88418.1 c-type cytochrome [Humisphaera borealis]